MTNIARPPARSVNAPRPKLEERDLPADLPNASQPGVQLRREPPPAKYSRELPAISIADADAQPPEEAIFPEPAPKEDVTFTRGPARRPQPRVADPLLQWASGLPTNDRRIYAGWMVEAGKLDDFDRAMHEAQIGTITIKHSQNRIVTHWALPTASLFLIADGVQSIGEMKDTQERYGVAFGWRVLDGGRQQSQLRCRVLIRELLAVGYTEPLLLTVKGTLTGDLLTAFTRQYAVLDAAAELRKASGKNPALPYYAFSIPIGPGPEVTRGNGGATKEITPMVALIPEPVTREYILAHWTKRAWVERIEALADETVSWSISESQAIAAGSDARESWEKEGGDVL